MLNDSRYAWGGQGQITVGASETQLPAQKARGVLLKALTGNSGTVYVANATGVTASNGYELDGGEETPWLVPPDFDLSNVYLIGSGAGQQVAYLFIT